MKLIACILVVAASLAALAQEPEPAQIVGTVREASGTVLPGVTVTASLPDGSVAATVVTNVMGSYTLSVPAGAYVVRTYLPGFVESQARVAVTSASRVDVPFTLQLAPLSETLQLESPFRERFGRSRIQIQADSQARDGNIIGFRGNVQMWVDGAQVTADELDYNLDSRTADVRGTMQVRVLPPQYGIHPLTDR